MTPRTRQRILVVDDHEAGRYATGRVLRQAGFEIIEAGAGGDALKRAEQDRPDLVLLDVRLPDMPGVEVCRRIKTSPEIGSTLVLQMSASAMDDGSRVAALEGGADGYITAPVEPAVLVATVRSLLRIRAAEQALQDAAIEWQATFDAIRDGVALLDVNGVIQRSNAALPALLGLERREIAGRNLDELIPPAAGDPPLVEVLESLHRTSAERTLGERSFSITIDPMADSADKVRAGVAIVTDITERKLLDRQLQHSQKLESIGLLAGGVAHDFNNLLVGILGNASLALDSVEDAEATRRLLQDVMGAGERAAELTRQMLAYAGKGSFSVGPVDLSTLIHELAPLIQTSIPRTVRLTLNLKPDLPAIEGDKTQIEQIVMNLIINAGEAIQGEVGSVTVTTAIRNVDARELGAFLTDHRIGGNYIVLEVRDTGSGMDQETLKRIFDPFFSTKFLGRGLGLSAALGIVRGHKGALKITSAPGQGTVFEVLFPAGESAPVRTLPREETALARGRGVILVVDDEQMVGNMAQTALTRAGYEILRAANGAEALSVFARNASRISLVLLDLVMPVMSGAEVLPHLLTMKPELPVIVSSGHREEECRVRLKCPPVAGFLQKPYAASSLAAKVQEVLGAAAPAGVEVGRVEMQ
jgi:PAS domain S-box-containing protein